MKLKSALKTFAGGAIGALAGYATGGALSGSTAGGIMNGLVQGAVGLGTDYLDGQMQLNQQKQLLNWQLDNNLALADKQLSINKALNNQAFQQNYAMWQEANQYNSPEAQMARLRAAGLNPNLVYGGGNVSGMSTTSAPTYQAAEYNAPMMGRPETPKERTFRRMVDAMSTYQQLENQQLTNDFTRQKIALAERDADRSDALAKAQIENMKSMYGLRGAELGLDIRRQSYNETEPKSWIGRNWSDIKGIGKEIYDRGREIMSSNKTSNRGSGDWVSRIASARYSR